MIPLIYKGVEYAEGTRLKVKTKWDGIKEVTYYNGGSLGNFKGEGFYDTLWAYQADKFVVEITHPVYPEKKEPKSQCSIWTRSGSGSWQSDDDIFVGLVIYIIAMILITFFNDRVFGWIGATIYFFMWKNSK